MDNDGESRTLPNLLELYDDNEFAAAWEPAPSFFPDIFAPAEPNLVTHIEQPHEPQLLSSQHHLPLQPQQQQRQQYLTTIPSPHMPLISHSHPPHMQHQAQPLQHSHEPLQLALDHLPISDTEPTPLPSPNDSETDYALHPQIQSMPLTRPSLPPISHTAHHHHSLPMPSPLPQPLSIQPMSHSLHQTPSAGYMDSRKRPRTRSRSEEQLSRNTKRTRMSEFDLRPSAPSAYPTPFSHSITPTVKEKSVSSVASAPTPSTATKKTKAKAKRGGKSTARFKCEFCPKTFTLNPNLRRHVLNIHQAPDQITMYKCPNCDKSFKQTSDLRRHQLVHTNVRKFVCEICGNRFKQKAHLAGHLKMHSRNAPSAKK
eukprot:TRINITY_DN3631_c0_g1_i1.p1 TRINITY_DN3631_c0_g1~~TRINITY_DN3631_c0_g1_i1.p1  ORF type:complete len:370 (+),score=72.06 TRINITY_DN3631_c0_g1_i1:148-1257(+)